MHANREPRQLQFPPVLGMEMEASRAASDIAEQHQMSVEKIVDVSAAVLEAFLNVLERGNPNSGPITLTVEVIGDENRETLQISVGDTTAGRRAERIDVAHSADQPAAAQKSGWGLKLIERLTDETKVTSDGEGTTITMSKRCH